MNSKPADYINPYCLGLEVEENPPLTEEEEQLLAQLRARLGEEPVARWRGDSQQSVEMATGFDPVL